MTICLQKTADILLQNNEHASKPWMFTAEEGSMYILSGSVRNDFDHGVVCPLEKRNRNKTVSESPPKACKKMKRSRENRRPGRESLNLRFSLHGNAPDKPFYVGDEMPSFIL